MREVYLCSDGDCLLLGYDYFCGRRSISINLKGGVENQYPAKQASVGIRYRVELAKSWQTDIIRS